MHLGWLQHTGWVSIHCPELSIRVLELRSSGLGKRIHEQPCKPIINFDDLLAGYKYV